MWRPNIPKLVAWLRAEGAPQTAAAPRWLRRMIASDEIHRG